MVRLNTDPDTDPDPKHWLQPQEIVLFQIIQKITPTQNNTNEDTGGIGTFADKT